METIVTSATGKTLTRVKVENKDYYLDKENGTFYNKGATGLNIVTEPLSEELAEFKKAVAKAVDPEAKTDPPPPASALPAVLTPSEAETQPELPADEEAAAQKIVPIVAFIDGQEIHTQGTEDDAFDMMEKGIVNQMLKGNQSKK